MVLTYGIVCTCHHTKIRRTSESNVKSKSEKRTKQNTNNTQTHTQSRIDTISVSVKFAVLFYSSVSALIAQLRALRERHGLCVNSIVWILFGTTQANILRFLPIDLHLEIVYLKTSCPLEISKFSNYLIVIP